MQLFKAEVKYWNTVNDCEETDIVMGFAETLSDFALRIEKTFTYTDEVKIIVINPMVCETELLYLTSIDEKIIADIEKENDY